MAFELLESKQAPTLRELETLVNNSLFTDFLEHVTAHFQVAPKFDYSGCGMRPGWNLKFKKGSWSLCTVYPQKGSFAVLVAIGERHWEETEMILANCVAYTQELYRATPPYNHSKWLTFEVGDRGILLDLYKCIEVRARDKKTAVRP